MAPGYLYKPPGAGRRVTVAVSARPAVGGPRRLPAAEPPVAVRRLGRLARLGAAVRGVGGARGLRDRRRHQRRPRGPSRTARHGSPYGLYLSSATTSTGRARCATPSRASSAGAATPRSSPATPRSGRSASRTRPGRRRARPPRWSATRGSSSATPCTTPTRQAELTSIWSDHLLGRPENHMTGVSFARGGYHRIGKRVTNGAGGYTIHRPEHWLFDGTGLDYGDVLGAAATIVGYECDGCDFTYRDGLPVPDRQSTARPPTSRSSAPRRPPTSPARPPHDRRRRTSRPRSSSSPRACSAPAILRPSSASPTATRCSARYMSPGGGTVDHLGQHRLGARPRRPRPPGRTDHPQHPRPPRVLVVGTRRK